MLWLADAFEAIRDFINLGGPVLRVIALTIFLMWVLIIERLIYFRTSMKALSRQIYDDWESRPERQSWNAKQIRELMISRFSEASPEIFRPSVLPNAPQRSTRRLESTTP